MKTSTLTMVREFKKIEPLEIIDWEEEELTKNLMHKLKKGCDYAKRYNIKSILSINTIRTSIEIKTVIKELGSDYVLIKGDIKIPVKSISEVEIDY